MPSVSSQQHDSSSTIRPLLRPLLSPKQIEEFVENGVLVVDNVLTEKEIEGAKDGFIRSLQERGVSSFDLDNLDAARAFDKLSSTNGSGGVLDIFYDDWKLKGIATSEKLFSMTVQLWKAMYKHGGQDKESLPSDQIFLWHPHGDVDFDKGYVYIDRCGYRLPSSLAQSWGEILHPDVVKKKKMRSIQRSLTPHLDCCPDNFYETEKKSKWRPIQCFVSLTDNLHPNTGGFEAAPGFHHEFDEWAKERQQTSNNQQYTSLCVGEYTHIRPKEDATVMKQIRHIPVKAGSAVFWDNRIPHANSYRNDSNLARLVVYCSFLPDTELNFKYVKNQLQAWKMRKPIRDQWNHLEEDRVEESYDHLASTNENDFTDLGKRLMGIDEW
jgi:hypothetical protein